MHSPWLVLLVRFVISRHLTFAASINLLCVPFGSLLSGVLTGPLGKRRVMQVSVESFFSFRFSFPVCSSIAFIQSFLILLFATVAQFADARRLGTVLFFVEH